MKLLQTSERSLPLLENERNPSGTNNQYRVKTFLEITHNTQELTSLWYQAWMPGSWPSFQQKFQRRTEAPLSARSCSATPTSWETQSLQSRRTYRMLSIGWHGCRKKMVWDIVLSSWACSDTWRVGSLLLVTFVHFTKKKFRSPALNGINASRGQSLRNREGLNVWGSSQYRAKWWAVNWFTGRHAIVSYEVQICLCKSKFPLEQVLASIHLQRCRLWGWCLGCLSWE